MILLIKCYCVKITIVILISLFANTKKINKIKTQVHDVNNKYK